MAAPDEQEIRYRMSFETLGLAPELLRSLSDLGYTTPTPIQEQAIPQLLTGRDLMGCAQTGTGKTAAFALPILHQIRDLERGKLRALVLVPTRELAMQVGLSIREYGVHLGLRSTAVYGGVPYGPQEMMLRHGVDVLVATPGRLKDHLWKGLIDFRDTTFLVLDEADRMLDMGFIDDVREIVNLIPTERQTMLFSATLDREIVRLAKDLLRQPVRVEVAPSATVADGVEHEMISVTAGGKRSALEDIFQRETWNRALVFTRTRRGAHQLATQLKRGGHRATSIHSDKTQVQRVAALEAFRAGRADILVATDIAARGLDVEGISHVINYDLPRNAEDYVHRIGRTARAGHKGKAISLVAPEDGAGIRSIERLLGRGVTGSETGGTENGPREGSARPGASRSRSRRPQSGRAATAPARSESQSASRPRSSQSYARPESAPADTRRRAEPRREAVSSDRRRTSEAERPRVRVESGGSSRSRGPERSQSAAGSYRSEAGRPRNTRDADAGGRPSGRSTDRDRRERSGSGSRRAETVPSRAHSEEKAGYLRRLIGHLGLSAAR